MLFCIPAIIYDIYLSLYFMVLFTYMLFFINSSTEQMGRINEAKQSALILILLTPNAIFQVSPESYETAIFKGTIAFNFNVVLAFVAVSFQIYLYFTRFCKGVAGIQKFQFEDFNKTRIVASVATGFIEELFFRITLFHIVGYDINAFILISIVSSTIYQIVKATEPIRRSNLVEIVFMNTLYTLSLALTGLMAAPIALKFLANVGGNLHRINVEYHKGCTFIKGRLSCCIG